MKKPPLSQLIDQKDLSELMNEVFELLYSRTNQQIENRNITLKLMDLRDIMQKSVGSNTDSELRTKFEAEYTELMQIFDSIYERESIINKKLIEFKDLLKKYLRKYPNET